jgi:hypothetical protein
MAAIRNYFQYEMNSHNRPLPDRRGRYPILTVKATFAPVDCPLLGEQFDIITESLGP